MVFWWYQVEHYPQVALDAPLESRAWSMCCKCIKALATCGHAFSSLLSHGCLPPSITAGGPQVGSTGTDGQTQDQKCSAVLKSLPLRVLKIHVYASCRDTERFNNQSCAAGTRMQELQGPVVCAVNLLRDSTAVITM